jgi:uncharacterized protein YjbJ (UPF0337 family)
MPELKKPTWLVAPLLEPRSPFSLCAAVGTTISTARGKGTSVIRNSSKGNVKRRVKEAAGSLSGNKDLESEERTDQDKGTLGKKGTVKDLLG